MHCAVWDKACNRSGDNSCQHCEDRGESASSKFHLFSHEVPDQEHRCYACLSVRAAVWSPFIIKSICWCLLAQFFYVFIAVLRLATLPSKSWAQGWTDWVHVSAKPSTWTSITVRSMSHLVPITSSLFCIISSSHLINSFRPLDAWCCCQCFLHQWCCHHSAQICCG